MAGESLRLIRDGAPLGDITLDKEFLIGRAGDGSPFDADTEISRNHARISRGPDGRILVEDLGSTNGTYLNGWMIPSPQFLNSGDRVQVGSTLITLVTPTSIQSRSAIIRGLPGYDSLRPPVQQSVLYIEGLRKSYGDREILKGVDLEVGPGEILGLLGANGAGKSTTVSIVAGLKSADGGKVFINGVDALEDSWRARQYLGLAPQDLGIYTTMTVRRNLEFFGELSGLRGRVLNERVEEIGEALSLTPLFDRPSARMSGGQKRRLHTGMAMLHHPPLLILDEPTVGADVRTRQEILEVVKKLAAEGRSIVYSTHYMPEIEELGASVAILLDGEIIARGSIAELIAHHSTTAVELHFDGDPPVLSLPYETQVQGSTLRVITDKPTDVAGRVIAQLDGYTQRLRGVEIIKPSLESVYLSLTDTRYSAVQPGIPPELAEAQLYEQANALRPLPPQLTSFGPR